MITADTHPDLADGQGRLSGTRRRHQAGSRWRSGDEAAQIAEGVVNRQSCCPG
ncbi:hypothetical protein ACPA9J_05490 [Pseudomonas aeruginosa]